jgi:hypothetical protein
MVLLGSGTQRRPRPSRIRWRGVYGGVCTVLTGCGESCTVGLAIRPSGAALVAVFAGGPEGTVLGLGQAARPDRGRANGLHASGSSGRPSVTASATATSWAPPYPWRSRIPPTASAATSHRLAEFGLSPTAYAAVVMPPSD